jgi:hypothetical protein
VSLAVLIVAALLTIAWLPDVQTVDGPVVLGQVTNGTADAEVPEGLAVTLHVFSGMEETDTYTTTLTRDGTFRFSGVAVDAGQTLVARTVYQSVTYVSEFATLESDQQETQLPITIYETTEDSAGISIAQLHIFLNQTGDQLEIAEYCVIGNTSDRAYIGRVAPGSDGRRTWSVVLPDGAENLRFDGAELGGRFVDTGGGFADTRPLLPGTANVEASFTYDLPYGEGLELKQAFDVPVQSAVLVLPEGGLALRGVQLSREEALDTQMGPAYSYTAGPLSAGEPLGFAVVPRASQVTTAPTAEGYSGLAVGLAALAAAGAAAYWMWRSPAPGPIPAHVQSQVAAIAALDQDYEAGLIPEKRYLQRRTSLKRQLSNQLSGR